MEFGSDRDMIVYHGTDSDSAASILADGINLKYGDISVDNAQGFYTSPSRSFATQRAKMTTARLQNFWRKDSLYPVVIEMEIDIPEDGSVAVQKLIGCTQQWQEFVLFNRLGADYLEQNGIVTRNHNLDAKYDVVIDETADSHVSDVVSALRAQKADLSELKKAARRIDKSNKEHWDRQISFHTARAIERCIKSMRIIELSDTDEAEQK